MCRPTDLLDAEFDAPLGVRVPLAHDGEYLRNVRLRSHQQLQTLQAAQIEVGRLRLATLRAQRCFGRRVCHGKIATLLISSTTSNR